jgi:hypothetical protein
MALALRVAANPSAPLSLLSELRACPAAPLPWTVAANPSVPLRDLVPLWSTFPDAMLNNPAFAAQLAADPSLSFLGERPALWLLRARPLGNGWGAAVKALLSHPSPAVRSSAAEIHSGG